MSQTMPLETPEELVIAPAATDQPVLLFAGQGAQRSGMGRELAEAEPQAMALWREAEKISGLPLREIYWEGDVAAMDDTRAMQPAMTVFHINMWQAFSARQSVRPLASAGHSLGEFAALAAAGVLSPVDALRITALRGRLMAEAGQDGAMAALVRLTPDQVDAIVSQVSNDTGQVIVAANYNTPKQTVVSGTQAAVSAACEQAKQHGGRSIPLKVSGAFHSPLMNEANSELEPLLHKVDWHDPKIPVFSNSTGKPVKNGDEAKKSILRQMISPVFWWHLLRNLYYWGARWWMEISPRAVLGKMIGPSMAGLASQTETLRVDLLNGLSSILNYTA